VIGRRLSHFEITAKLGEGGMGEVYRAEDLDLHRPVALKVLAPGILQRPDMRARFLREARTAAALNHPNVCTIYEVGEVDDVPYIAMELIEGASFEQLLAEPEPVPLPKLLRAATRIAAGLAAAHAAGIVHRDLKPGNVMLTPDRQVKILDFGLAKPTSPLAGGDDDETLLRTTTPEVPREGTILGTVSYMSPEQAEGREVDSRSDVFSFGVLLYQMATGKRPFEGETPASTLAKILEAEPEPLSAHRQGLPAELEAIVSRCLRKDPGDRYADGRDLVAALRGLPASEEPPPAAPPEPAAPKVPRWIWGAALVVLILLVAVLAGPWRDEPVESPLAPAAAPETPSVAVLPFHNLSAEEDAQYFSAGVTEEILSKLSRLDGLEVASRSSVASFTDPARDVQQIARDLGVRYLLDGSVRRAGDRVRVSAQLVDASTGRNLWSEDFEGSLEDVFAMQEETALKIAERLDLDLSPAEQRKVQRRSTDNVFAYDAFLRAMALSRDWGNLEVLTEAIEQFEVALEHDPDFAAAMAGLAFTESNIYRNFDSSEERIQRAEDFATRAAELDPTLPDAVHALAMVVGNRFDYERASKLMREAVRLAPKEALFWDNLSWTLAYETPPDSEGAEAAAREALRLQPIYPGAYYHLGRALIQQGRYDEAREAFQTSLEQDPAFLSGHLGLAQVDLAVGDYESALASIERMGKEDSAINTYYRAAIHSAAGEADEALRLLRKALDQGFRDFTALEASPHFASLRADPRYQELIGRYKG
jgi:serine/threonine protein kinase/Tfp pilus assembly protein PilF